MTGSQFASAVSRSEIIELSVRATVACEQAARIAGRRIRAALTIVGMRLADHWMRGAREEPTACMTAARSASWGRLSFMR